MKRILLIVLVVIPLAGYSKDKADDKVAILTLQRDANSLQAQAQSIVSQINELQVRFLDLQAKMNAKMKERDEAIAILEKKMNCKINLENVECLSKDGMAPHAQLAPQ